MRLSSAQAAPDPHLEWTTMDRFAHGARPPVAAIGAEADAAQAPLVLVVDDDADVRDAIQELLHSVGIDSRAFGTTRALLDAEATDQPGCLILDVRMPGLSGLDLQAQLAARGNAMPVVFLTAHGDIPMSVQAMKAGAVDFLTKPVRDQTLLDAVAAAIDRHRRQREAAMSMRPQVERIATLTRREWQVLNAVAQGRLNKQIAHDLGISEITVKAHRGSLMRKMRAATVADLVRGWGELPLDLRRQVAP
jgi:FixJ family two-component response regulator